MPRPPKDRSVARLSYLLAVSFCLIMMVISGLWWLTPPDPRSVCLNRSMMQLNSCLWGINHEHGPVFDLAPYVRKLTQS